MVLDHPQITVIKSSKEKNIKILFGKEKKKKEKCFSFYKRKKYVNLLCFYFKVHLYDTTAFYVYVIYVSIILVSFIHPSRSDES